MAGVGELAAGAALKVAFTLLFEAFSKLVIKSHQFRSRSENIKSKLDYLKPVFEQIEDGSKKLDRPNDSMYFKNQMEKCTRLIEKLSRVSRWNFLILYYSNKIVELDASIRDMVIMLIPQAVRNIQDIEIRNQPHDQVQNQNQTQNTAPYPPSSPIGLDEPLKELKTKLFHNDHSMVSITAPGGSGKTTLAQMVCHDQEVKDKFNDMIFFATVTNKPDLDGLQKSLQIFLKKTEEKAALFVLDDVWPESSGSLLEEIYQLSQGSSYKTLVTSRSSSKYGSNHPLHALTDDEALTLLKNSIGLAAYSSGTIDELLKQTVTYCRGSPLAITVVGKSLFIASVEIWTEKIAEWSTSSSSSTVLRDCLQTSLDVLCGDKAIIRECFIDLASLPEGGRIRAGVLIDMWVELHSLLKDALSIAKLQHLNERNLAKLVVTSKENEYVDSCYSEQYVTQHGMLRDLALHQIEQDREGESKRLNIDIRGDVLPIRWTQKKDKLKKTRLLSISTDGEFSSKWNNMHLPEAEVLILNFQTKNFALPKFSRKMCKALKVLIVRNTASSPAKISDFKLSSLPNLKRARFEHVSISSIRLRNKKKLNSLEKISLFMCNTGQASGNSSIPIFEALAALPNLVEMNIDYCNDLKELPADLCGLKCLKILVITNCHKLSALPEEIGKLFNLEVLRLRSCTMLETLNESITDLKNLEFLDISDCCSMKELPKYIGKLSKLRKINMRGCTRLQMTEELWDLENILKEVICDEETEELWEPFKTMNLRITVAKVEFDLRWLYGH